jgi:replicative DNA helicase
VRLKWLLRRTLEVAREAETCALAPDATEEVVAGAQAGFATLMDDAARGRAEASNLDVMCDSVRAWKDAFENKVPAIGLQTPWAALTEMCCGLEPGIFILAGRPSAGKTTIEDQICCELARDGVPVARATLDSTRKSLLERAIARKAGVSLPKMKFGYAGEGSVAKAQEAADSIGKYPLFIRDDLRTVGGICSWFRAMVLKHGVKLLTVDYIQLIGAPEMGRSEWDANTRVSYVSGQLKKLSLSLGVPMLVLSQLNRGAANDEREPELNDLRDSGALEQDAEKVAMVFIDVEKRNEMDKSKPGTTKKIRPIRIALKKHKNGETGTLCYWMYPPYFRLEEVENFDGATPPEEGLMGGRSSEKATEPAEFKSGAPDWYPSEDGE